MSADEVVDVEEYLRTGRVIPADARRFLIRVDKQTYTVDVPTMTGRELLTFVGKVPPEKFSLYQKPRGSAPVKIGLDATIDFRVPGIERFLVLPLDQTEGLVAERRMFDLPADDRRFLDETGRRWETVQGQAIAQAAIAQGGPPEKVSCVVLYGADVGCAGYNHNQVDMHVRIEGSYPDTHIDMVWVSPPLARLDGQPIGGLVEFQFDGRLWQRWSRHRTLANPWRPGVDNLETHLTLSREWFRQEFEKR